jgi:hypothetical protein
VTSVSYDGVTYSSSSCRLLDFGKDIKMVGQANPLSNTSRYFWNFGVSQGNESEQGTEKSF